MRRRCLNLLKVCVSAHSVWAAISDMTDDMAVALVSSKFVFSLRLCSPHCSTCLLSSSSWALQNSCSIEQSSSLNNPTSSQFFKKRVGVGVWSGNQGKILALKSTTML